MTIKIAIVGQMASGKSTLANRIIDYYKYKDINIEKRGFADKVYNLAYELFNMRNKDRKLLQQIGTKMREINKDVWVNYTLNYLPKNVIIEDCRYENELDKLIENGFTIIKINIPKEIQLKRLQKAYPKTWQNHLNNINHESETNLNNISKSKFDYIINYNYRFTDIINII
jgi:dephospho-CoA kinase